MTSTPGRDASYPASATLRDRCRGFGLPTWRLDSAGEVVDEPTEAGLTGLWLRSAEITRLVRKACLSWTTDPSPQLTALFDGCWLIPLPEKHRRRRAGIMVAMALGERALTQETFNTACMSAQLEPFACRSTIQRLARYTESSTRSVAAMLQAMSFDLSDLSDFQTAVSGFTTELTQSYETISLLYSLGRSMRDLDKPERFVAGVCDRVHETLPFCWLAAAFADDSSLCGALAGKRMFHGSNRFADNEFEEIVHQALARTSAGSGCELINAAVGFEEISQVLVQPIARNDRPAGVLMAGGKFGEDPQVSSYDTQLLEAAAAFIGTFLDNAGLYADQQTMFLGSLKALTASIDAKDRYTCGHSERVAHLASILAQRSGFDERQAERVHMCGLLHDVGKIGVPESVLCKPGRLTDEEFALVRLHPEIGHRILKDIPLLQDILPGVMHHHERWDGKGYPAGLAGEDIPMLGRILAIADTFDAMSSNRSYRPAMPREKVLAEIERCAGAQFDPALAALFTGINLQQYDEMVARHAQELVSYGSKAAA